MGACGGDLCAQGTIPVDTIKSVAVMPDAKKKRETDLYVDEPGRGYKLRAKNKEDRDAWIAAIQGELDKINAVVEVRPPERFSLAV